MVGLTVVGGRTVGLITDVTGLVTTGLVIVGLIAGLRVGATDGLTVEVRAGLVVTRGVGIVRGAGFTVTVGRTIVFAGAVFRATGGKILGWASRVGFGIGNLPDMSRADRGFTVAMN